VDPREPLSLSAIRKLREANEVSFFSHSLLMRVDLNCRLRRCQYRPQLFAQRRALPESRSRASSGSCPKRSLLGRSRHH